MKVKSKCCKDGPRCKRCPAVWKKLANQGLAERVSKSEYVMLDITKKQLTAARAR